MHLFLLAHVSSAFLRHLLHDQNKQRNKSTTRCKDTFSSCIFGHECVLYARYRVKKITMKTIFEPPDLHLKQVWPWFAFWNERVQLQIPVEGGAWSWRVRASSRLADAVRFSSKSCLPWPPAALSSNAFSSHQVLAQKGSRIGDRWWWFAEWSMPGLYFSNPLWPCFFSWVGWSEMH